MTAATAEAPTQVGYDLHPKQAQAARLFGLLADGLPEGEAVEELCYGGQAGGGKSHLWRALAVTVCCMWPGAQVRLFRRTYPELEESHIAWIQREVRPPVATYNQARHNLTFWNGSELGFRHCKDDAAAASYLTAEWAALFVDQAEQFTEFQLRMLRSRVRQPIGKFADSDGGPWRRIIGYSANPGGPSHDYLRTGFRIDSATTPPETVFRAAEDDAGMRRAYLPARLSDNPSLDAEAYRQNLKGLPPHLVEAYLNGDWSVILGAYYRQFHGVDVEGKPWHVWPLAFAKERYRLEPDAPFPPRHWLKWAGCDGGVRDPWCVEYGTRAPDGRVFVYREQYQTRVDPSDQATTILATLRVNEEVLAQINADPNMFTNRANLAVSDAAVYRANGVPLIRGTNSREQGWRRISEFLNEKLDDGYPRLVLIDGAAPQLQRTLPLLLTHPLKREDIDGDTHGRADPESPHSIRDDPADALRYLIMPAAAQPEEVRPADVRPYIEQRAPAGAGRLGSARGEVYATPPGTRPRHRVMVRNKETGRLEEAYEGDPRLAPAPVVDDAPDPAKLAGLGYTGVGSRW